VELMEKISEEAGFTWHIHIVGNKSNEKFSSSYTACVHEVALNETDFCIGSFWMTTERLLMTPFTGNIHRNDFKLVVYATEEFDYWSWSIITGPLMPFTTRAWLAICAVVFYVSLSLRVIEGDGLGLHKDKGDVSLTDHAARTMGVHVEEHLALALLDRFVSGAIKCVYNSIIAITQGIHAEEVKTFPGRVVSVSAPLPLPLFLNSFDRCHVATNHRVDSQYLVSSFSQRTPGPLLRLCWSVRLPAL
jgi:hypothetical protein